MSALEFQDADSIGFRAWWETRVHPPVDMGGAMATVYVAAGRWRQHLPHRAGISRLGPVVRPRARLRRDGT